MYAFYGTARQQPLEASLFRGFRQCSPMSGWSDGRNFQQNDACRLQGVAMESTSEHQFELSKIINFRTQMLKRNHPTLLPSGSTTSNFGDKNIKDKSNTTPRGCSRRGHRFIKSKVTLKVDTTELQRYQSCSVVNLESDLAKYRFCSTWKGIGILLDGVLGSAGVSTTLSTLDTCESFHEAQVPKHLKLEH